MRILLLLSVAMVLRLNAQQIFFMPYENKIALNVLQKELRSAKKSIKISIYSFTNKEIAKALRDSARRGVRISMIYDHESNIKNPQSVIGYLAVLKNIQVCTLKGRKSNRDYYGIMHQKIAIIDDRLLIVGSANWSKNAFENNYEVLLITSNRQNVQKALKYYEEMKRECKKYGS